MSLRTKIAKWLAPELAEIDSLREGMQYWMGRSDDWSVKAMRRGDVLRKIAAQRTPGSNATVRRMCDLAEAELNWRDASASHPFSSSLSDQEAA